MQRKTSTLYAANVVCQPIIIKLIFSEKTSRVYLGFTPPKILTLTRTYSTFFDNFVLLFIPNFTYPFVFTPIH